MLFNTRMAPSAKLADGRLVLNLPDAETPALWMMDLNDAATSVLRLENDRQGLYVIKKHIVAAAGSKAAAAETVAVYRDRERGVRAMACAAKALEKARGIRASGNGQAVLVAQPSRLGRWFFYFVMFWFLLYMLNLDKIVLRAVLLPFVDLPVAAAPGQYINPQEDELPAEMPASLGDTSGGHAPAGVPLSAEEFLKNQPTNLMPN